MVARPIQQARLPGLLIIVKRFTLVQYIVTDYTLTCAQTMPDYIECITVE